MIGIEDDADKLAFAIDDGASGISAGDVGRRDKIQRRVELELVLRMLPAYRQLIGKLGAVLLLMDERPAEVRPGRNLLAILLVSLHQAKGQAKRAGGIGINRIAE